MKKEEIIEMIDETDDEHLILFRNKYSPDYIGGWIDALERLKEKLKK